MLELTARHADAWNLAWFGLPDERLGRSAGRALDACARVGRDPSTLGITVGVTVRYPDHAVAAEGAEDDPPPKALVGTPEEIAEGLAAHAAEAPSTSSLPSTRARRRPSRCSPRQSSGSGGASRRPDGMNVPA